MRPISRERFDALAGYARLPHSVIACEEVRWYEEDGERVLGTVIRDRTDGDFGSVLLARDEVGCFRCIKVTRKFESRRFDAQRHLESELRHAAALTDEAFHQGGPRRRPPADFFAPKVPITKLAPGFQKLAFNEGFSPARGIIEPMMKWFEDADGNFVEQFQTTGFDARIWELYLYAAFIEAGYACDRSHTVPDFICDGLLASFCAEAVTIGASGGGVMADRPEPQTLEEAREFAAGYMAIRYAGPLTDKLKKRYWEHAHVADRPFVLAIHDFSAPFSMLSTRSALPIYLYGFDHDWDRDANGQLRICPRRVEQHRFSTKSIESGFFGLEGAEHVSAVLYSNSGTISKFNRMGVLAGFGSGRVRLRRRGLVLDHDPNAAEPKRFEQNVIPGRYSEHWGEGLEFFHNPNAKFPLASRAFPAAAHHRLLPDGQVQSQSPTWHPLSSATLISLDDRDEQPERA